MFKRGIRTEEIEAVLVSGQVIKEYPDDKPYPSFLMLGFSSNRPLHIVASTDKSVNCNIITTYEPDAALWDKNFSIKK